MHHMRDVRCIHDGRCQTGIDLAQSIRGHTRLFDGLFGRWLCDRLFDRRLTTDEFKLEGMPALILFAVIVAYFVVGRKYLDGTIWQRILGAR